MKKIFQIWLLFFSKSSTCEYSPYCKQNFYVLPMQIIYLITCLMFSSKPFFFLYTVVPLSCISCCCSHSWVCTSITCYLKYQNICNVIDSNNFDYMNNLSSFTVLQPNRTALYETLLYIMMCFEIKIVYYLMYNQTK